MSTRFIQLPFIQMIWKPLRRKIRARLPNTWRMELVEFALRQPLPLSHRALRRMYKSVLDYHGDSARGMWLGARLCDRLGDEAVASKLRFQRLSFLLLEKAKTENLDQLVALLGEVEKFNRSVPFAAGQRIALMLSTPKKRARLLKSVLKARTRHPHSVFLLHLETLIEAKEGNYREAGQKLVTEIAFLQTNLDAPERNLRLKSLENSWRVVDRIARDQMDWAMESDVQSNETAMPAQRAAVSETTAKSATTVEAVRVAEDSDAAQVMDGSFAEWALQTRRREDYLSICEESYTRARSFSGRVKAIGDMLRTGVRHIPHYGTSYALASEYLQKLLPELDTVLDGLGLPTRTEMETVCSLLRVAERLDNTVLADEIRLWLETQSNRPGIDCLAWEAADALAREASTRARADAIMSRMGHLTPVINRDVKNYLSWAMHCHQHDAAHAFVRRLPAKLRRTHGLLYHVHILQRESRFDEALELVRAIHAQSLVNPLRANPVSNESLIKRTGELEFLAETAKYHSEVPQPSRPEGLILVLARNIDQLRRVPLMALQEFKRRNWAVIPLVEGLLPVEPTGNPAINHMIGAVTPHAWLSPDAERVTPELKDYRLDPMQGRLFWGEMDLSHPLWEDAAINRRRHSVDWSCPELQHYLHGLGRWTCAVGRVLEHAREVSKRHKLKVGTITLFNARLPDAMPRFYCESRGNAETFFQLHAANGYQNYFTNFSTNISQRFVLRNMTRYSEARSASFPLPENFERYYAASRNAAPKLLEKHRAVTQVKRSTAGQKEPLPEAQAARARILEWRAKGGKVACAFGKVVFDSSVPFDGGVCHRDIKDWLNHCIRTVDSSNTLLLIKPHPHELNNQIATFPTEYFADLIEEPLGENVMFLGHRWFDMHDMQEFMDLGVIYNGTTTIELGIMGIPAILSGHFAAVDYPIGQITPQRREEFEAYLRFERRPDAPEDLALRAAVWLDYMANQSFTQPYRFHSRPVTNKVLYPPYWFRDDLREAKAGQNKSVRVLVDRALGLAEEPVDVSR